MEELIGRKIVGTRQMTQKEIKFEGWDRGTTLLILDDGSIIYPSQDDEGNGCGALFGRKGDKAFRIGYQDAYGALNHSMSVEGKDGNWHCVKCGRIKDDSEDDCECTFSEPKKKGEHECNHDFWDAYGNGSQICKKCGYSKDQKKAEVKEI